MKYLEFEHDKKTIRGFLHGENAEDVVLLMHGFMGNKVDHHFMMKTFAQDIAQEGFMSYRFDFLGCGDSDGEFFEEESIASQIEQARSIVRQFKKKGFRVHLFAFSMGGVVASHTAKTEDIASLFLLSPAGNFDEILPAMIAMGKECEDGAEFNGFHISGKFMKEAHDFPYFEGIENYKNAVKIVQGSRDQYVSEESLKHYQSCFDNCETVIVENADHCYSTVLTTESVRKEIKKFYGKIKNLGV